MSALRLPRVVLKLADRTKSPRSNREIDAATGNGPTYYMINCARPTHFETTLDSKGSPGSAVSAPTLPSVAMPNSTRRPPLTDGNPIELGAQYRALRERHPHINVFGGCCGTDRRHLEAICGACAAWFVSEMAR